MTAAVGRGLVRRRSAGTAIAVAQRMRRSGRAWRMTAASVAMLELLAVVGVRMREVRAGRAAGRRRRGRHPSPWSAVAGVGAALRLAGGQGQAGGVVHLVAQGDVSFDPMPPASAAPRRLSIPPAPRDATVVDATALAADVSVPGAAVISGNVDHRRRRGEPHDRVGRRSLRDRHAARGRSGRGPAGDHPPGGRDAVRRGHHRRERRLRRPGAAARFTCRRPGSSSRAGCSASGGDGGDRGRRGRRDHDRVRRRRSRSAGAIEASGGNAQRRRGRHGRRGRRARR